MQSILDAINEWIKEILIGAINGNLSTMFGDVNEKVGTIAAEVGQTPQGWNANIFSMIQTLSENVIVPIAGLVITYVLCYELISMVTEKNNMHDVDTSMFFKWVFKAFVAVYLVTHTFDITMAVFDMAQHVVSGAAGVIGGSTEIDVAAALASMQDGLDAMEIPELLLLVMETSLVSLCMKIMSVLITVILYGRMIEIYLSLTIRHHASRHSSSVSGLPQSVVGTALNMGLPFLSSTRFPSSSSTYSRRCFCPHVPSGLMGRMVVITWKCGLGMPPSSLSGAWTAKSATIPLSTRQRCTNSLASAMFSSIESSFCKAISKL